MNNPDKHQKQSDIHTVPVFEGEPIHDETPQCWCEPELHYQDELTKVRVWSHQRPQ